MSEEEQEVLLRDHYFRVDPAEYFERRLWAIMATADLAHDSPLPWNVEDPQSLYRQFEAILGRKIDLHQAPGDTLTNQTMVAAESYSLMQHVIETALRYFVVAGERKAGRSPMRDLLGLFMGSDVRKPLQPIFGGDGQQFVERTLFPRELVRSSDHGEDPNFALHVEYLFEWLHFFAYFYDDEKYGGSQGNNQIKHGAAVSPQESGAWSSVFERIKPDDPSEETLASIVQSRRTINGPSVTYALLNKARGMTSGVKLRTDNSDPATCLAIAQVGIDIVRSMWHLAKVVASPGQETHYVYSTSPLPADLFRRTEFPPRAVVELLSRPTPKGPRTSPASPDSGRVPNQAGRGA